MLEQTTTAQSSALLAQWLMTQQAMLLTTPTRNPWPPTSLFGQNTPALNEYGSIINKCEPI